MSCACENKRLSQEYERIRSLAKALAKLEGVTAVTFKNYDGTFGFMKASEETVGIIVEYITPY